MSSYDVFLSHNSADKPDVREVAKLLKGADLTYFFDEEHLPLGKPWQEELENALDDSAMCAVFLGPGEVGPWHNEEMRAALEQTVEDRDFLVIPVLLPGASKNSAPKFLKRRTWADLTAGVSSASMDRLIDVIRERKASITPPRSTKRTGLYGTPRMPTQSFVGRSGEIEQLREALERSSAVRVAASVEGLPGVGKTELALQFVYQMADKGAFPGGIFWFDAEDPDLATAWGGVVADGLGVPQGEVEGRAAEVLRRLASSHNRALIVLDNVESWTAPAKPGPLPTGGHLRVLITTRRRKLGGNRFAHVAVGFLQPPFDRQLLEDTAGRELDDVEELLRYLKGHALAVELAGAYLSVYEQETPESYLEELRSGEVEEEVSDMTRYERTVAQGFGTLWDRLDEDVRSAWKLAACFEPEPVTDELSESVGLTRAMRRKLQRLHLIEVDQDRRWWMHRLTRRFGKGADGTEEAQVAFVEGCASFADRIAVSDGFRHYLPNRHHLDAAVKAAPKVIGEDDQRVSEFQALVARGLTSIGDYRRAHVLFGMALALDLKNLGEDHRTVSRRRNDLAWVLEDLGDLARARELYELALASDLKNLGENHPSVAIRRGNLANVLRSQGDLDGARELYEQALASGLKNFGEDHLHVATYRNNLGLVLRSQGDLDGARELFERAVASDLKNLGEDHPVVARCRNNLAGVLRAQGDLDGARELFGQALESDLKNLGEDHPEVAIRRNNLAGVLRAQGDLVGARELFEQALESDLKNLGEDHPNVAIRRSNFAGVLRDQGDLAGACELLEQALESGLKNLGEDHPTVAIRRNNLGLALQAQGDLDGAREFFEQALESFQKALGDKHPSTRTVHKNLDTLLRRIAAQGEDDG